MEWVMSLYGTMVNFRLCVLHEVVPPVDTKYGNEFDILGVTHVW